MALTVTNWRPINKGSLLGSCTVELTVFRIRDVSVIRGSNGIFAGLPSKPMIDSEGKVMIGDDKKRRYTTIIEFKDRGIASQFSDDVVAALRSQGVDL